MSPERVRQIRESIARIATKDPELTSGEIAERVGCAKKVVQAVVRELRERRVSHDEG